MNKGIKKLLQWLNAAHAQSVEGLEVYTLEEAERLAKEVRQGLLKVAKTDNEREYANSIGVESKGDRIFVGPLIDRTTDGADVDHIARVMEFGTQETQPRPVWRNIKVFKGD